jgi:phosphate transport system substrate-binding protein
MTRRRSLMQILCGVLLFSLGCSPSNTTTIQGAGATFPAPLYKRWFLEFYKAHHDVRVNYQAIGSGAGVSQLREGLTDFAASDEFLKQDRLDEVSKSLSDREGHQVDLIQIPLTAGAIGLCYNIPGNPQLNLPRKVYVGLALGEIQFWDDEALHAANPDVALPHQRVTFIRRAESSGTTFVFTNHLSAIDDRWKLDQDRRKDSPLLKTPDGPGASKTPQWLVGIGGKGNAGVAALISQTPGAFGYLEAGYADLVGLKMAMLENHAGHFVEPTDENCRAALGEAKFGDKSGATVPDPKGKMAYPIVTITWVIARKHYVRKRLGDELRMVLNSCLEESDGQGQSLCEQLGYVKLPADALEKARQAIQQINAE